MMTNSERADHAERALEAFTDPSQMGAGYPVEDALTRIRDLLTNLAHLIERYGSDAPLEFGAALEGYDIEVREDEA
jgi:hypothetical protein